LTYAVDTAIGFFSKLGFTLKIGLPHEWWRGYIKDYDKATLMHCRFRRGIDYTKMPDMLHAQRQSLLDKFPRYTERRQDLAQLSKPELTPELANTVYEEFSKYEHAWPFQQSVQEIIASYPTYTETIKNPIDLLIIKDRVTKGYYRTWHQFAADIVVMLKNCQRFNGETSDYTKYSAKCLEYLRQCMLKRGKEEVYLTVEKGYRYIFDPDLARKTKKKI
jgi:histone acetyltransferase